MNKEKTIYIIEDSKLLAEIIAIQVKHEFNCETIIFSNGDHVIEQVKVNEPSLIILDYHFNQNDLYYKNGEEFLAVFRKQYKIPVIVFSGQRDKATLVNIINKGANDYINKDKDDFMQDLIESIKNIFELQLANKNIDFFSNKIRNALLLFVVMFAFGVTLVNYFVVML